MNKPAEFELISFNLCPFVQRSVITLLHKQVPYDITYIDLVDPPLWFLEISPFAKVPVLRVNGKEVIFESAVINEYIDEVTPGRLHPRDPLKRAMNRAWIEFGSACLNDAFRLALVKSEEEYNDVLEDLLEKFDRLEDTLGKGPFFNGARLSLIDAAYAPLFIRLQIKASIVPNYSREQYPRVAAWSDNLLALNEVRKSAVPDLASLYKAMIGAKRGYLATQMAA